MKCRPGCGACCIALSISSSMPLHLKGKASGVRCLHLDDRFRCLLHDTSKRPTVCESLRPMEEMCGNSREEALATLEALERATTPSLE